METRKEYDSLGEVCVPCDKYYGAQTKRSMDNFRIGTEKMPEELISAFAYLKIAAARANAVLVPERMTEKKEKAIEAVAKEILDKSLKDNFPLSVWQTGSGTQTNMNVNEVIANRGNELAGEKILHPNDTVNMSQSSNDTFPTAMHISAVIKLEGLVSAIKKLCSSFEILENNNKDAYKSGRTHLEDATPITFAQEISGWRKSLEYDAENIISAIKPLRYLAIGATAVGTGLNCPEGFDSLFTEEISALTGTDFYPSKNKFHALTSKSELVFAHGALKALSADLWKTANDIRFLASGPRLGLGEITIPENEPGSSIMPGKVNPTQCEAVTMVACRVMGNDTSIGIAASQGNFELNVFMPVIIYSFLQSATLLTDVIYSFEKNCVRGIKANKEKMRENLNNSLMLVTCLTPYIGYENAAKVVKKASAEGVTLKEACVGLGFLTDVEFDRAFKPEEMC